ncbi:MAG: hypothetical protein LBK46_03485 [Oscillospiraceae bacterium]|jgi:hypothetical protein|nr:hypothetical protein [Oscillospiraceae bacterium]
MAHKTPAPDTKFFQRVMLMGISRKRKIVVGDQERRKQQECLRVDQAAFNELYASLKHTLRNFAARIDGIITVYGWTYDEFAYNTGLSRATYHRIKRREDRNWPRRTVMKLVASLRLNPFIAQDLVESAGYKLSVSSDREQLSYAYMMSNNQDKTAAHWDEFLKSINPDEAKASSGDVDDVKVDSD